MALLEEEGASAAWPLRASAAGPTGLTHTLCFDRNGPAALAGPLLACCCCCSCTCGAMYCMFRLPPTAPPRGRPNTCPKPPRKPPLALAGWLKEEAGCACCCWLVKALLLAA